MVENRVDVILLNWNGLKYNSRCIISLLNQSLKPHRIIIVDQASTDGSKEQIRELLEKNLKLPIRMIELEENVGFSKGNNIAVKYALEFEDKPDYILYFNNDTIAFSDMIETMVKCFSEVEKVGAVGLPAFDYKTKKQLAGVGGWIRRNDDYLSIDGFGKYWSDGFVKKCLRCGASMGSPLDIKMETEDFTLQCRRCGWEPYREKFVSVDYVGGGCMMVPREIIEKVDGFDEERYSPIYEEDLSLCCEMREMGYKIIHINASGFYHEVSASTKKDRDNFWKKHIINKNKFIEQWGRKIDMGVV